MTRKEIVGLVLKEVKKHLGLRVEDLEQDILLFEELDGNEANLPRLIAGIEGVFRLSIPTEEGDSFRTVTAIVNYIEECTS